MHAPVPSIIPPDLLMAAYRSGIFPMADSREDPDVYWIEPRKRAILPLDAFHCSRSLAKLLRKDRFRVTCNAAFDEVLRACSEPRPGHPETWISHRIEATYRRLHQLGHAHSIECWLGDELAGGLYGVGFDRAFCGESMFSRETGASKVALAWLVAALRRAGARVLDCQFITGHLASMGAIEIPRSDYIAILLEAQAPGDDFTDLPGGYAGLIAGSGGSGAGEASGRSPSSASSSPSGTAPSSGKLIAQSLTQTS